MWNRMPEAALRQTTFLAFAAMTLLALVLSALAPPGGWFQLEFPAIWVPHIPAEALAKTNVGLLLDFGFLLAYPLWFSLWFASAARRRAPVGTSLGKTATAASHWIWAAAPLDALENAGILLLLNAFDAPLLRWIVSLAAGFKWLVVGVAAWVGLRILWDDIGTRRRPARREGSTR